MQYSDQIRKGYYIVADIKGKNNPNYKTGLSKSNSGVYHSWCAMRQRCRNPKNPKYPRYGGRGITICEEWETAKGFYAWAVANGWAEGLQIDRIDNNGNYCPENCRWISRSENSRKKSTTKIDILTAQEIRSRINEDWHDLAKEYKCSHGNIWFIMHNFTHMPDGVCAAKLRDRKQKK